MTGSQTFWGLDDYCNEVDDGDGDGSLALLTAHRCPRGTRRSGLRCMQMHAAHTRLNRHQNTQLHAHWHHPMHACTPVGSPSLPNARTRASSSESAPPAAAVARSLLRALRSRSTLPAWCYWWCVWGFGRERRLHGSRKTRQGAADASKQRAGAGVRRSAFVHLFQSSAAPLLDGYGM